MSVNEDSLIRDFVAALQFDESVVVPPGDDCAAIDLGGGELTLLAVDQVAADTHYFGLEADEPTPPEAIGRKVVARNLSDIAAMGGTPKYALVASAFPMGIDADRATRIGDGLRNTAAAFGVQVIGGDVGRAGAEVISLTIIGSVAKDRICLRSLATPGDMILVTGEFGGSLETGKHLSFQPRLAEGRWLAGHGCRCLIDVSDGLLKDLLRVCHASSVAAVIDEHKVPLVSTIEHALYDGEDYELIAVVPQSEFASIMQAWPFECTLTAIGCLQDGSPGVIGHYGDPLLCPGFSHFD